MQQSGPITRNWDQMKAAFLFNCYSKYYSSIIKLVFLYVDVNYYYSIITNGHNYWLRFFIYLKESIDDFLISEMLKYISRFILLLIIFVFIWLVNNSQNLVKCMKNKFPNYLYCRMVCIFSATFTHVDVDNQLYTLFELDSTTKDETDGIKYNSYIWRIYGI